MARKDYDEIKSKFGVFVETLKTRETDKLNDIIVPELVCYMSIAKGYTCGSKHTLYGIKNFINDIPKTDIFHSRICNFICSFNETEAQQYAEIVCLAANIKESDKIDTFEFTIMIANHWTKLETGWMINEMRCDIAKFAGNIKEFEDVWYFEKMTPVFYDGMHYPCINAEFDAPWERVPNGEKVLSDEEQICEQFSKYVFGIDWDCFAAVKEVLSDRVVSTMPRCESMTKRDWIVKLKFQRMKERYWFHPTKPEKLVINGNKASVTCYRMTGHRQRDHEYVFTKENVDIEHACAKYVVNFEKEKDGIWRIVKNTYYLGFVDLGPYRDDLYGEYSNFE